MSEVRTNKPIWTIRKYGNFTMTGVYELIHLIQMMGFSRKQKLIQGWKGQERVKLFNGNFVIEG